MSESFVQVTEGAGKKLHTNQRTIGANTVEDEVVILGEPYLPSYAANANGIAANAAGDRIFTLIAGASLKVRIWRIEVWMHAAAAATAYQLVNFRRITSHTGGTSSTPQALDTTSPAPGALLVGLPTAGTLGGILFSRNLQIGAVTTLLPGQAMVGWEATAGRGPIVIPAGTTNGFGATVTSTIATVTYGVNVWFDETSF